MLKSLYAGVSGLQSHQIAMDIESNNIANVNTTGFKYSRANFSNLLAQTRSIATAPQGELGGKNAVQVGLGSTVSSMTTIYSQGSIQNSDKNTDVAIQGDGFFIVSPDGGTTYKYTRAGDFKFDASGNFVDNNGFITQGWVRDQATGKVDATAPIQNIRIAPGLTTPASPTSELVLKANLNAGILVESFSPAFEIKSATAGAAALPALDAKGQPIESGDIGVMFNDAGSAFSLQNGQGIWMGFEPATLKAPTAVAGSRGYLTAVNPDVTYNFTTGAVQGEIVSVVVNGTRYDAIAGIDTAATAAALTAAIPPIENVTVSTGANAGDYIFTAGAFPARVNSLTNETTASAVLPIPQELSLTFELDDGTTKKITTTGGTGIETAEQNGARYVTAINAQTSVTGISALMVGGSLQLTNNNTNASSSHNIKITAANTMSIGITDGGFTGVEAIKTAFKYTYNSTGGLGGSGNAGNDKTFKTIADLKNQMQIQAQAGIVGSIIKSDTALSTAEVAISDQGKIQVTNPSGYNIALAITGLSSSSPAITENTKFTKSMEAMNSTLAAGSTGKAFSQSFNAATHSSSIDIFDSLGSKHTIRMEFRKIELSTATGSRWAMSITVPLPSAIDTVAPTTEKKGYISFGPDGALGTFDPPNVSFTANNGSTPEQQVKLSFGSSGKYDGMTSFDSLSSTSGISQDGFTGGDLVGVRIDQSGTIVGSFSNGRSLGLAQIAMSKFTNNEGLATEGGNIYMQTANSGDATIGTAATSGRGFIQSSALEASNVDLSRSLTQLIIIQRGYQANGKTITTSDQLLQTLIGLKN